MMSNYQTSDFSVDNHTVIRYCLNMNSTLKSEVNTLEVIEIGSRSPVRYLECTDFIDHTEPGEELADERDDDESDDRNYISSLFDRGE
jgi:hypothetical protein